MKHPNENRKGYKKTPIGWIPTEWECIPFGKVCHLVRGPFGGSLKKEIFVVSGYKVYEQKHAIYKNFEAGDYFITPDKFNELKRFSLKPGDLIMSCSGTAGEFAIFPKTAPAGVINQALLKISTNSELMINTYLNFYVQTKAFRDYIFSDLAGGAIKNIAEISRIKKIPIAVPPICEQDQINQILFIWTYVIDQIQSLISAKKCLKKDLMQQLFSGRMRFSEFGLATKHKGELPTRWKIVNLKDISQVYFSGIDKKSHQDEMKIKLCNYLDVYKNEYITSDLDFMEATASVAECKTFQLKKGDVIITKDSETPDDIGIPAVVIDHIPNVICGYHLALIRPDNSKINSIYLSKILSSNKIKKYFSRHANGATRFGLSNSAIKNTIIHIPPIEEQQKIGLFLFSIDHQISLLQNKVKFLSHQKNGLMKKLLSGEVRVKIKKGEYQL